MCCHTETNESLCPYCREPETENQVCPDCKGDGVKYWNQWGRELTHDMWLCTPESQRFSEDCQRCEGTGIIQIPI